MGDHSLKRSQRFRKNETESDHSPGESMTMNDEHLISEQCRFDRSEQAVGERKEKDNFTEIKD